ncbi:tetratricopeptide repeat protein [Bradyrhizobium prioriisuperbiae]|uniref:tetratricopeptide repeat protein n=1 Tax=Bradyrhizobium prioriisuperbiae TaxID=2854389 RepID=UPI0028ED9198|nr:tetratricopeptide repeat protein [Bradyrhizobium prioritasuperba]
MAGGVRRGTASAVVLFACAITVGLVLQLCSAAAETVEVAPGVKVTKRTFQAPFNEQPFFGFAEKSASLREADEAFVSSVVKASGSRKNAFDETTSRAWRAIAAGNIPEAAKRFNQAFLLAPEQSEVFHGFAIVVAARFDDAAFSEELFQIARNQPAPLNTVNADYGRFLLMVKRPRDAQPVLEQAVKDVPAFGDAWSNLAIARVHNGDHVAACTAAAEAAKLSNPANVTDDLAWVRREARCS